MSVDSLDQLRESPEQFSLRPQAQAAAEARTLPAACHWLCGSEARRMINRHCVSSLATAQSLWLWLVQIVSPGLELDSTGFNNTQHTSAFARIASEFAALLLLTAIVGNLGTKNAPSGRPVVSFA